MKRKRILTLVLAAVVATALLAALAGPASASAPKRVDFRAYSALYPTVLPPPEVDYPNGCFVIKDWLWVGQGFTLNEDGTGSIPNLTGYTEDYIDVFGRADSAGNTLWAYGYSRFTVYVGCGSPADVVSSTSIWKLSAVSRTDPATGTDTYTGVGYGVAGVIKGWVMHWQARINVWTGERVTWGYYTMK